MSRRVAPVPAFGAASSSRFTVPPVPTGSDVAHLACDFAFSAIGAAERAERATNLARAIHTELIHHLPHLRESAEIPSSHLANERANVAQYMPTLSHLKAAAVAIHRIYQYADARADESDAWASAWRAGDVNQVPYNHHACIKFLRENRRLAAEAHVFAKPLLQRSNKLAAEDEAFARDWSTAWRMMQRLDALETNAPCWSQMHVEYGEWADPRDQ